MRLLYRGRRYVNIFFVLILAGGFIPAFAPALFAQQRGEFTLQTVDSETRQPLPCSVFVRNEKGGAQKVPGLPFSYDHFISPGEAVMAFSLGTYPLEIERGLEYYPVRGHFVLNRGAKDVKVEKLRRFTDLSQAGWWSGDLDVRRPVREVKAFMQAGDVHVAAVFPENDGGEDEKTLTWFDRDRVFSSRNYILRREGCELALLNLTRPLAETAPRLARPQEQAANEATLAELHRLRKAEPEMVVNVLDADAWDIPLLAAAGFLDAFQLLGPSVTRERLLPRDTDWEKFPKVKPAAKISVKTVESTQKRPSQCEMLEGLSPVQFAGADGQQRWAEQVVFHLLNTGHKIVPSAGSGSGMSPNGVGANRVYVRVDGSEYRKRTPEKAGFAEEGAAAPYDWQAWWEAFRRGEVVVTNGPLMQPFIEGCYPGELLEYDEAGPISLAMGLTLATRENIQYLEVIVNGKVTQTVRFADAAKVNRLPDVEIEHSGWFMLRAVTDSAKTYCVAMSAPYYVKLGGEEYISRRSAEFFRNWQTARIQMLEDAGVEGRVMEHHRTALKYWEKLVESATAE